MIFGFNTDVPGKDATYHVQTEDRGVKNPVIDSIIYVGGKIVDRRRTPYVPQETTQADIEALVRKQHRDLVESIRSGTFTRTSEPSPAPALSSEPVPSRYTVQLLNQENVLRDNQLWFEFSVWDRADGGPVHGAQVDVQWSADGGTPDKMSLQTGEEGTAEVSFPIPEGSPAISLLVCAKGPEWSEFVKFTVRSISK